VEEVQAVMHDLSLKEEDKAEYLMWMFFSL
jgi:hypothetical protein